MMTSTNRRALLLQQIEREYASADLSFTEAPPSLRAEGYIKVGFAISGGEVTIGPGCGERLVAWLLTRDADVA